MSVSVVRSAFLVSLLSLPACDMMAVKDYTCLSKVLDVAGVGIDELKGVDADARLAEALLIAEDVLGDIPVMDCDAEESLVGLLDTSVTRGGSLVHAYQAQDVPAQVSTLVQDGVGRGGEVALVIDTTGSMQDDTRELRAEIDRVLAEVEQKGATVSVAFFGDNQGCDADWYHRNPGGLLPPDDRRIQTAANNWEDALTGGCDWQESLYDAVWKTASELDWQSNDRTIIVITDADPHDEKTNHSEDEVKGLLKQQDIAINTVLVGLAF